MRAPLIHVFFLYSSNRQTFMFSATMPPAVERITRKYLRRPAFVTVSLQPKLLPQIILLLLLLLLLRVALAVAAPYFPLSLLKQSAPFSLLRVPIFTPVSSCLLQTPVWHSCAGCWLISKLQHHAMPTPAHTHSLCCLRKHTYDTLQIGEVGQTASTVEQHFIFCSEPQKKDRLFELLRR